MTHYALLLNIIYISVLNAEEHCDLNKEECFMRSNVSEWKFTYHTNKQDYIEEVSKGKSWLLNPYRDYEGLARIDGVEIGYEQKCDFDDGRSVDVITRSMKPLLLEIPNFLSHEECDHMIKRAQDPKEGGMFNSLAKGGLTPIDNFKKSGKKGKSESLFGNFIAYDSDDDGFINMKEIITLIHWRKSLIYKEQDIHDMFKRLNMTDVLEDGVISFEEFETMNTAGIEEECEIMYRTDPRFQQRNSKQAWLFMEKWIDPLVHNIRERLVKLSGLPREIIYGGEMLQVVNYQPFGHYHAHMDSESHANRSIPCCHQIDAEISTTVGKCKLCRYITFLMYLNDVEEGGETAFPVAGGPLMTESELRGNDTTDKYNLSEGCKRANLLLKPKKGMAVLWYNHLVNETDGWMGKTDPYSLHGGCDVKKGEKWISNMWIPAPYGFKKNTPSIYLNWKDFYLAEKQTKQ